MKNKTTNVIRTLSAGLACALLVWGAACGGGEHGDEGCGELCASTAACPGAAANTEAECNKGCTIQTELAEERGCTDGYTAYLECISHSDNLCDDAALDAECKIQEDSFTQCLTDGA